MKRKISPKFFRPKFFHGRPCGMSVPECLFFQHLEGLTEVFGRTSAGISGQKLPLWAEFSFPTHEPIIFYQLSSEQFGMGVAVSVFGHLFACTPGPFPCSTALFLKNSHRAGPVLQEFGPVLRAGVWHSTSVV